MGRLFWKIFLLITLVQMITVLAVGISIAFDHDLEHHSFEYATAPGVPPPPAPGTSRASVPGPPGDRTPPGFPGAGPEGFEPGHGHDGGRLVIPLEPVVGGLVASAITAALLAWFMARPIRTLRSAFAAAAAGRLDIRIDGKMGRGKDELTDLGRDFDLMVERLNALVSGQRRLLHDVSHEMRSPLARIQAAIGLASQQPEQAPEALERLERESVRMDRLIGELLALARLQAGFTGSMTEDIDLRELLAVIIDDASFEARACNRRIESHDDADGTVRGNVELLRRALENVVRNGIKYSPVGGTVTVRCEAASAARVAVTVCDSGPGVPAGDLTSIFEPFFRGHNGGGADGHGLGLAIARRIVEAHEGTIAASNGAAGGLCVRIELPLQAA